MGMTIDEKRELLGLTKQYGADKASMPREMKVRLLTLAKQYNEKNEKKSDDYGTIGNLVSYVNDEMLNVSSRRQNTPHAPDPSKPQSEWSDAERKFSQMGQGGKTANQALFASENLAWGIPEFLMGVTDKIVNPEKYNDEGSRLALAKEEAGGLKEMLLNAPAQADYALGEILQHTPMRGWFGNDKVNPDNPILRTLAWASGKDPETYYRDAVGATYESGGSDLAFGGAMLGGSVMGAKGIVKRIKNPKPDLRGSMLDELNAMEDAAKPSEVPLLPTRKQAAEIAGRSERIPTEAQRVALTPRQKAMADIAEKRKRVVSNYEGSGPTIELPQRQHSPTPKSAWVPGTDFFQGRVGKATLYAGIPASIIGTGVIHDALSDTDNSYTEAGVGIALMLGIGRLSNKLRSVPDIMPKALRAAENRYADPNWKALANLIEKADNQTAVLSGTLLEELRGSGLKTGMFSKKVEAVSPGMRKVLDQTYGMLKKVGIDVGYIQDYVPRMWKQDIAQAVFDDVRSVATWLEENKGNVSDQQIANMIRKKAKGKSLEIIEDIMQRNQGIGWKEAVRGLNHVVSNELFPRASFEFPRKLNLPSSVFETDLRKVIPRYITNASKRVAEVNTFGKDYGKGTSLLSQMREIDPNMYKDARKMLDLWSGAYEMEHGFRGTARKWADGLSGVQFATKIASGLATIPNITQPLISVIPALGLGNWIKGMRRLTTKEGRLSVRKSGATLHSAFASMAGHEPTGLMSKFSQQYHPGGVAFNGINLANLYQSAAAAEVAIRSWYKKSKQSGRSGRLAQERLREYFDIDPSQKLTEAQVLRGMHKFARDSQLQTNALRDPFWAQNPKARPFLLFKRFGLRQAKFMKDSLMREVKVGLKAGTGGTNVVLPLLRLAIGGYFGGEFVVWARNQIKGALSGEPLYRKDDHATWERFLNNIAAVGTMGVISDFADWDIPIGSKLTFMTTPAFATDLFRTYANIDKFFNDKDKYGAGLAFRRQLPGAVGDIGGTLTRAALQRAKTPYQKEKRASLFRGRERGEILDHIIKGEPAKAKKRITLWNKNNPDMAFTAEDINYAEVTARAKRQLKDKWNAQQ